MGRLFLLLMLSIIPSLPTLAAEQVLKFDARLHNYDYPFPVQFFGFESQGQQLEMAYGYLKGKKNMPTITLLHGKNFNAAYWQQTASALNTLGYNVVMPDQIGFGKSSKPVNYQYSFAALAQNTRQLLDSLQIEKSIILGHSMGGMLASRFALLYPQHSRQLILLNPIGLENYLHYVQYKDPAFFYQNERQLTAEKIRQYQQKNYYDGAWTAKYEALTTPLIGWIQGPDAEQMAQVSARSYDMIFTQPVITEFKDLQVPTTLILGTRDRTGPGRNWKKPGVTHELGRYDKLGKRVQELRPETTLIELSDLGHLPHIEAFPRFIKALQQALSVNQEQTLPAQEQTAP